MKGLIVRHLCFVVSALAATAALIGISVTAHAQTVVPNSTTSLQMQGAMSQMGSLKAMLNATSAELGKTMGCANAGKIYGPKHTQADSDGCIPTVEVSPGGYVGIGTDTPRKKLHLSTPNESMIYFETDNDGNLGYQIGQDATAPSSFQIREVTVGPRLLIDDDGNVGIGTEDPDVPLEIHRNSTTQYQTILKLTDHAIAGGWNGGMKIEFEGKDGNLMGHMGMRYMNNGTWPQDAGFEFQTNSGGNIGPRMTIRPNGYVGIGTTEPGALLDLQQKEAKRDAGEYILLRLSNGQFYTGTRDAMTFHTTMEERANQSWVRFKVSSSGYGSAEKARGFQWWTQRGYGGAPGLNTPALAMVLDGVGNLEITGVRAYKRGAGGWLNSSDLRLKNVLGAYDKGLDAITKLTPVEFRYKEDNPQSQPSDITYQGFLAQDVQDVFPEAVSEGDDGYLRLDIHLINVAVINALKELKAQNDALQAANDNLRARDEAFLKRLQALEATLGKDGE